MVGAFLLTALVLLLAAAWLCSAARTAWRARTRLGAAGRGLAGVLFLVLALLAATVGAGIRGYRALTFEELAATVRTEPLSRQRFRATITLPDHRLAMYDLAGDAFYVDAHVLKWHPLVTALGLHTAYELDRVAGRYNDVADERVKPHTAYALP